MAKDHMMKISSWNQAGVEDNRATQRHLIDVTRSRLGYISVEIHELLYLTGRNKELRAHP